MENDRIPEGARKRRWLNVLLVLVFIGGAAGWGCYFVVRSMGEKTMETVMKMLRDSEEQNEVSLRLATELKENAARREEVFKTMQAQLAARETELAQREAAIAGREDAATERTQSSFQGLLIQQQLTKNLEALKASLPDMTPEVERLTREHAQFDAERQRLQRENAELRRKLNGATPLESR